MKEFREGVLWRSVVGDVVEKCCEELLWRSVVEMCCGEVLEGSVVEKCCGEVL